MRGWVLFYVFCFAALTATDLASTSWATSGGIGHEFNAAVATKAGGLDVRRFLVINTATLVFTAGMLTWAVGQRRRIDPRYLDHPFRAVFNYWYMNPFAKKIVRKSALHFIALAPTILAFKAFVSIHNALIAIGAPDPVTASIKVVRGLGVGPTFTYCLVVFLLLQPAWLVGLRTAAWTLRTARAAGGEASRAVTPA
jgi:hypothetical protein